MDKYECEATDGEFLREIAQWIFHKASPSMGLDQYHCDRLTHIARKLDENA